MAQVPCTSTGVTNWYGAGFDTLVGSSGELSIYNPTATPAVFNVVGYTAAGYTAPAPFQGLSVGAHSQMELNLGSQIVNTANVGVHVSVLRGSVTIVGVQQSGAVVSLISGHHGYQRRRRDPRRQPRPLGGQRHGARRTCSLYHCAPERDGRALLQRRGDHYAELRHPGQWLRRVDAHVE